MIRLHRPDCPNPQALAAGNYKHAFNKAALVEAGKGKCMYCESKVTAIYFGDVEHIKPKAPDKFPELEFEWSNLGYVCGICNNSKGDKYDFGTPFIDPYLEDPSEHLLPWGEILLHRNGSERGQLTIKEIDLNRGPLIERRMEKLKEIGKAIDAAHRTQNLELRKAAIDELKMETANDREYSIFVAGLLKAHTA